ncbi:LacI family DNA-binding transcriptional regulator [Actinomycetospora cinnamomea]|uniref:DNA-binding LacI/PurR family transcriptional regulator n=1 Tax=Actinomycetospora cinnamomea TaxID=663609 RepID=A0A2U1FBA7_9PSEU|nr:LacI family DNA-binding transcriptional regulator [Actinomycetospora cinnamomea]PVZ09446.1 DNA-binding LacI/PurR family transcriptional regulator [Actinomycetospora cinnamomea]
MDRARRVTLATVASALGVSRATVSNAYNHPERLSPRMRNRVLHTARELGYAGPHPLAATLSRGRVNALGLVHGAPMSFGFSDPAAVLFLQGVSEVCEREDLALVLIAGGPDSAVARVALVDAVVCYCDVPAEGGLATIVERGLPFVVVDGPRLPGAGHVGIDDRRGAEVAARHLLDLGHTRFGVVAMPLLEDGREGTADLERQARTRYRASRERLAGYREAIEAAGHDWAAVTVEERSPYGRDAGGRAAAALLARDPHPTALLAMSDELALGAMAAAADAGLAVPGDVSVVGFDDVPAAADAHPPLTTVRQPHREKGRLAASLLLRPGGVHDDEHHLPVELVVRGSTAPPPAR